MVDKRSSYGWGAAALLAGLLLRAAFVATHARFGGDALTYGDLAHNLLAHHVFGFTEDRIRPTLIRLPGYPLFLAACFAVFGNANYLAVLWVQVAVDLLTCVLLGVLTARLAGARAGWAAVWLAVLCPFTANYAAAPLTETLSLFCVVVAFYGLERWTMAWQDGRRGLGWASVVGAALAYAVLLRPDQGLLAAAVVPAMAWVGVKAYRNPLHNAGVLRQITPFGQRPPDGDPGRLEDDGEQQATAKTQGLVRGVGPAVVASLIVVLPLLVWAGRNWRTFHVIQPLAPRYANDPGESVLFGFQRWYRTWAIDFKATVDVYWKYDGETLQMKELPPRAFDDAGQLAETRAIYDLYNVNTTSTPELDRLFAKLAAERVAEHPVRYYAVLPAARVLNMLFRPRTELMKMPVDWWNVRAHPHRSEAEIAYGLLNAGYLVLALVGLVVWWRRRGVSVMGVAMVGFVVLRLALLLTLDNSEPRYTLECFPVFVLLAAVAVAGGERVRV